MSKAPTKTAAPQAPSAWQLERSVSLYQQLQDALVLADPTLAEDEAVIEALIDRAGSTAPPGVLLSRLIDATVWADRRANEADALRQRYIARRDRFRARAERMRATIFELMDVLETTAHEGELGAADIRRQPARVIITDITKLPEEFIKRADPEPRKTLIATALKEGPVDGAELSNPGRGLRLVPF